MSEQKLVLALDTATETTTVALAARSERAMCILGSAEIQAPRAAMSRLLMLIEDMLSESQHLISEVSEMVCGRGPGSFTGVRIGVATAKGIAHGLGVPLYGVSTLESIAWRFADDDAGRLVGVVGDAMRGETYTALFRCVDGAVERLSQDAVMRPHDAAEAWLEYAGEIELAGNGLAKYRNVFDEVLGQTPVADEWNWRPSGEGILRAYASALCAGELMGGHPGALLPFYARLSDAEENERTRAGLPPVEPPGSGVGGAR